MVLKLLCNLYGLKDAGRAWFQHPTNGLDAMRFFPTGSNPFIFAEGTIMIVLYVDDCMIISHTNADAKKYPKT